MPWFKVDDSFYDHPKVFDAPDCAVALWTRAGCWSARSLNDGFVPSGIIARLCDDPERATRELVQRGLWSRTRGGYRFHDWDRYQPSKDEVLAIRKRKSDGGTVGNHRRWHAQRGVVDPECTHCEQGGRESDTDSHTDRTTDRFNDRYANPPDPSRPHKEQPPTELLRSSVPPKGGGTARGTRLPDSFAVTPEMVAWAQANTPGVDARRETERFRDHWAAATGRNATKRDWIAAWRNWMRSAADRAPTGRASPGARPSTTDQRVAEGLALAARMASPNGTQGMPWNTPKQLSS